MSQCHNTFFATVDVPNILEYDESFPEEAMQLDALFAEDEEEDEEQDSGATATAHVNQGEPSARNVNSGSTNANSGSTVGESSNDQHSGGRRGGKRRNCRRYRPYGHVTESWILMLL